MLRSLAALLALLPALALAGERTLVVKTYEEPGYPTDPAMCQGVGIKKLLGASVWSLQTNAARGEVMNEAVRELGTATACATITSLDPYAPKQYFVIRFDLREGSYLARGQCDMVNKDFPAPGLAMVGCALEIVESPDGSRGFATSSSILVLQDTGSSYGTGSVWTLHLYGAD